MLNKFITKDDMKAFLKELEKYGVTEMNIDEMGSVCWKFKRTSSQSI